MSLRTMMPDLPKPVRFCCDVTCVSIVEDVPTDPGRYPVLYD